MIIHTIQFFPPAYRVLYYTIIHCRVKCVKNLLANPVRFRPALAHSDHRVDSSCWAYKYFR